MNSSAIITPDEPVYVPNLQRSWSTGRCRCSLDQRTARAAAAAVRVDYEVLPVLLQQRKRLPREHRKLTGSGLSNEVYNVAQIKGMQKRRFPLQTYYKREIHHTTCPSGLSRARSSGGLYGW